MRAQVDREEHLQKEREERAENKRKWMEKKERKAWKREMGAEGRELSHRDPPARLVNGPRGSSNRSRTEGKGDSSQDQGEILIAAVVPTI